MDEKELFACKEKLLASVTNEHVITGSLLHVVMMQYHSDSVILRALSELVQSGEIKRYEYTYDGNHRYQFYMPAEARLML